MQKVQVKQFLDQEPQPDLTHTRPTVEYLTKKGYVCFSKVGESDEDATIYILGNYGQVVNSAGYAATWLQEHHEKKKIPYKFSGFGELDYMDGFEGHAGKSFRVLIDSKPVNLEFSTKMEDFGIVTYRKSC